MESISQESKKLGEITGMWF